MGRHLFCYLAMLQACVPDEKANALDTGAVVPASSIEADTGADTSSPEESSEDTGGGTEETDTGTSASDDTGDSEAGTTDTAAEDTGSSADDAEDAAEDAAEPGLGESAEASSGEHDAGETDDDEPGTDPAEEEELESALGECDVSVVGGEDLACGSMSLGHDRWMINVTEGMVGEVLNVKIDTFRPESAFDPKLLLISPDGCIFDWADDDVECTYPPPTYLCPAMSVVLNQPGIWKLAVLAHPTCEDSTSPVEYLVQVGGISALPVLIDDDLHETMPYCVRPEVEHGEECWTD